MATYKCKDCSHEVISTSCLIECEICGSFRVVLLENFKVIKKVDEPKRNILNSRHLMAPSIPAKETPVEKVDESSRTIAFSNKTRKIIVVF